MEYELTYILRPNLEEADADARIDAIAEQLKNAGGEVVGIEKMGKKRLAYEINDVREGIYTTMRFRSEAGTGREIERLLSLNEDVMRGLLIKLDKHALAAEKWALANPRPPAPPGPVPLTPPQPMPATAAEDSDDE